MSNTFFQGERKIFYGGLRPPGYEPGGSQPEVPEPLGVRNTVFRGPKRHFSRVKIFMFLDIIFSK